MSSDRFLARRNFRKYAGIYAGCAGIISCSVSLRSRISISASDLNHWFYWLIWLGCHAPGHSWHRPCGVLDVQAALDADGYVAGDALSPRMGRSDEGEVITIQDTALLWGDDVWGNGYLWANNVVNANALYKHTRRVWSFTTIEEQHSPGRDAAGWGGSRRFFWRGTKFPAQNTHFCTPTPSSCLLNPPLLRPVIFFWDQPGGRNTTCRCA
ncbi:MAG: hypothetical protein AAGA23_03030 [Pseudomonadota bacterium]